MMLVEREDIVFFCRIVEIEFIVLINILENGFRSWISIKYRLENVYFVSIFGGDVIVYFNLWVYILGYRDR